MRDEGSGFRWPIRPPPSPFRPPPSPHPGLIFKESLYKIMVGASLGSKIGGMTGRWGTAKIHLTWP